mmetsp:Transcript_45439/g.141153  ORF Transcript_45439/g.141153 Transcript_45439/m.141153 type:complete len:380 (+) Transcript_45439:149-1288(+)
MASQDETPQGVVGSPSSRGAALLVQRTEPLRLRKCSGILLLVMSLLDRHRDEWRSRMPLLVTSSLFITQQRCQLEGRCSVAQHCAAGLHRLAAELARTMLGLWGSARPLRRRRPRHARWAEVPHAVQLLLQRADLALAPELHHGLQQLLLGLLEALRRGRILEETELLKDMGLALVHDAVNAEEVAHLVPEAVVLLLAQPQLNGGLREVLDLRPLDILNLVAGQVGPGESRCARHRGILGVARVLNPLCHLCLPHLLAMPHQPVELSAERLHGGVVEDEGCRKSEVQLGIDGGLERAHVDGVEAGVEEAAGEVGLVHLEADLADRRRKELLHGDGRALWGVCVRAGLRQAPGGRRARPCPRAVRFASRPSSSPSSRTEG